MDEVYRVEVVADYIDRTEPGLSRTRAKVGAFESSLARTQKRLSSWGRSLSSVGRSMTRYITLPILGAAAASVKLYMDFHKSLSDIRSLVGASRGDMKLYETELLKMGRTMPQGPQALAEALYFVTSSGFEGASALRVLKASAKAAAAGLGETETVADAVTSAVNAYGEKALSAAKSTDILMATVRLGKAEPTELAGAIGRVIAPAEAMKVEFEEVGGALASLSLTGLDAAEAVTGLRGVLMTVMNPTTQGKDALKELGLTTEDLQSMVEKDFMGTMIKLRKEFGDDKEAIGQLFGNVRALNAFLSLTGRNVEKNTGIFREMGNVVGETDKAFERRRKDPMFQYQLAMSNLKTTLIEVAPVIMPVVSKLLRLVEGWARAIGRMDVETLERWVKILGALMVAGPAMRVLGGGMRLGAGAIGLGRALAGRGAATAAGGAGGAVTGAVAQGAGAAAGGFGSKGFLSGTKFALKGGGAAAAGGAAGLGLAGGAAVGAAVVGLALLVREVIRERKEIAAASEEVERFGSKHRRAAEAVEVLSEKESRFRRAGKGAGTVLAEQNDLIAEANRRHRRLITNITGSAEATEDYERVTDRATEGTKREERALAGLIGGLHFFGQEIPKATQRQVDNLIAMGDWRAAAKLLRAELNGIVGALNGIDTAAINAGQAAFEASAKATAGVAVTAPGAGRGARRPGTGAPAGKPPMDRRQTLRLRGPGQFAFRVGNITEDVTFGGRGGGGRTVQVNIGKDAVQIRAHTVDDDALEDVAGRLADKVGQHLSNAIEDE